jgi:hypothetical protein
MNSLVEMINSMEVREEDETYKNAVDYLFDGLENGIPLVDEDGNAVLDENGNPEWESPPQPNHFAVRQYKKYLLAAGVVTRWIIAFVYALALPPFLFLCLRIIIKNTIDNIRHIWYTISIP